MGYDSSGNATVTGQRAVTGQTVEAPQLNVPLDDIQSMLSQVLLRSGVAPMTGPLNMNGNRVINLGDASSPQDAVTFAQFSTLQSSIDQAAPTGAVQMFRLKTAPSGWIVEGQTIGNIASGAAYSNVQAQNLFTAMWTQFTNTELPILDQSGTASTRGGSALADWNANKRMPTFVPTDRFPRASGALTVGATQEDDIKAHTHAVTDPGHAHAVAFIQGATVPGTGERMQAPPQAGSYPTTSATTGISIQNTGGTETRPKSSVYLFCIKL